MKLLVFQAHNDDAVIGAGGTLLKLMKKGWRVGYVYITDSRGATDTFSPEENKIIRAKEADAEKKFLGIKDFWELGIPNGELCKISLKKRKDLIEKMKKITRDFKPDAFLIPSLAEGHPEHRETCKIVSEAMKSFSVPAMKFLLWSYPDIFEKPHDSSEMVFAVDITKELKRKIAAIRKHKTQVDRRHYDKIAESFNTYLALIFKTKFEAAEIIGIDGKENEKALRLLMKDLKSVVDLAPVYKKWC